MSKHCENTVAYSRMVAGSIPYEVTEFFRPVRKADNLTTIS
jgi:hypothetical protein